MRSLNMNESGVYHFNDKSIFLNNIQKLHYMCQRDLSLNDLSDYMQLSKEYLCTVFKSKMQTTIMKFLLDLRISHARIFLLQYPEKRVAEISQMCGFDSPSYFGMQFKKIVGVTPENFRRGIHLAEKKQRRM